MNQYSLNAIWYDSDLSYIIKSIPDVSVFFHMSATPQAIPACLWIHFWLLSMWETLCLNGPLAWRDTLSRGPPGKIVPILTCIFSHPKMARTEGKCSPLITRISLQIGVTNISMVIHHLWVVWGNHSSNDQGAWCVRMLRSVVVLLEGRESRWLATHNRNVTLWLTKSEEKNDAYSYSGVHGC